MTSENKQKYFRWIRNTSFSLLVHVAGIIVLIFLLSSDSEQVKNPAYLFLETNEFENETDDENTEQQEEEIDLSEDEELVEDENDETGNDQTTYYTFEDLNADTSSLKQIYKETTRNIQIKYPNNWTFIDQNVKNKLDGVTFWSVDGRFNPPPYIHLEVKEKYLFNRSRFQDSILTDGFTGYFNPPEILEDQVSQEVYIRTNSETDFSIKLIMEGEENFSIFQPEFFGMIKSFRFGGNSYF